MKVEKRRGLNSHEQLKWWTAAQIPHRRRHREVGLSGLNSCRTLLQERIAVTNVNIRFLCANLFIFNEHLMSNVKAKKQYTVATYGALNYE